MINYQEALNCEQLDAISEPNSVLLLACPGSGKTRTLTYKLAKELEALEQSKERNKWIVAITYTHAAAEEIKERIEHLGLDTAQLWIGTIHSFCLEWIIKPYSGYHEKLAYGYSIVNSHETEEIISSLCLNYNNPSINYYDCGYFYSSQGLNLSCSPWKRENVQRVILEYQNTINLSNRIDFEQILYYSYELILSNPTISRTLSSLFDYILVDEYQDTKEIQYEILGKILSSGDGRVKAFIVGDPNQAIYASLGGYAISFDELCRLTQLRIVEKELVKNYRSSARIVDFFSNYRVHSSPIEAAGSEREFASELYYSQSINAESLAEAVSNSVKYFHERCGIEKNEICIVAPWWIHLASLTRRLTSLLPDYQFNGPGLTPFSRDIDNFWYKLAKLALTEPSPQLFVRRGRWAKEIIEELDSANIPVEINYRVFLKFINELNSELSNIDDGILYLQSFFSRFMRKLGLEISQYSMLREHHEAFFDSSSKRIQKIMNENEGYDGSVATFKKVFMPRTGITVSTIHGVKGCEFDAVIGYGLVEGFVPHFSENSEESAKKLIYVLASRAKKHLYLISERGRMDRFTRAERPPTIVLNNHEFRYTGRN